MEGRGWSLLSNARWKTFPWDTSFVCTPAGRGPSKLWALPRKTSSTGMLSGCVALCRLSVSPVRTRLNQTSQVDTDSRYSVKINQHHPSHVGVISDFPLRIVSLIIQAGSLFQPKGNSSEPNRRWRHSASKKDWANSRSFSPASFRSDVPRSKW
ncbi:hypothetical protein SBV1_190002 [Verrucomicrobia bacterium]|nr:hypothetical protein SBV1_190002 [Verrucomicrobiota bacterium]